MSSFLCPQCGAEIIDSDDGYITECDHYPIDRSVDVWREDGIWLARSRKYGIMTQADTRAELSTNIRELFDLWLAAYRDNVREQNLRVFDTRNVGG